MAVPPDDSLSRFINAKLTDQGLNTGSVFTLYSVANAQTVASQAEKLLGYGTWQWDWNTDHCLWSEGLISLFDYSSDAFGSHTKPTSFFIGHVHPEDQETTTFRLKDATQTGNLIAFNTRILTREGKLKTICIRGRAIPETQQIMCIFQEIIEVQPLGEQKIIHQLERQEQLLRLAEQNFLYGHLEWDLETDEVTWSEGMMMLFGYLPEEFGDNPKSSAFFLAHIPPEELQKNQDAITHYRTEGTLVPFEQRIVIKDGTEKILSGEWRLLANSKKVLCTLQDITREKQKDATIAKQSALFRGIIDNSPMCIVLYRAVRNLEGKIIDFVHEISNPANRQVTGRTIEQLASASWLTLYPENKTNGFFELFVNVVETGQEQRQTFEYDAHGIKGWFDGSFVKSGDGLLMTYQDISTFKQQQQLIEQANSELRRSNTELEYFAYVASHDLQEPLRKVKSFGSLLAKEYATFLEGNGLMYIQRMQLAVDRMQELISDLLEYSRVGRLEEGFQPIDLSNIITTSWNQLKDEKENLSKNARLTIQPALPSLRAIPSQMSQLFINLLSNALKFFRPEEPLHIEVAWQWLSTDEKRRHALPESIVFLALDVHDNGIGFEPEYTEKIFGLFQRLHGRSEYEGSGIGLAICKRILENHNGFIQATGKPDQGATFRMVFPYELPS